MTSSDATEQAPTSNEQLDDETRIRAVLERWASALENEDMAGLLAQHAADIVMFDVPPPHIKRGIEAYQRQWDVFFAAQGKGVFELNELEITAGDGVALCHSIVTCGSKAKDRQFKVRLTIGLQKANGDWIVTHEHHLVPAE